MDRLGFTKAMWRHPVKRKNLGFSLLEILVASTVLLMLLVLMVGVANQVATSWRYTTGRIEAFQDARRAFESVTRQLSQATLNPYWDYTPPQVGSSPPPPTGYIRQSELRFASGIMESPAMAGVQSASRPTHGVFFNANLGFVDGSTLGGLNQLLNTWGYYVEFGSDAGLRPAFLSSIPLRHRFRLMEMMQPSEQLGLYRYTSSNSTIPNSGPGWVGNEWFTDALTRPGGPPSRVLTENIITLVILPKLSPAEDPQGTSLAPNYLYRSDSPQLTNTLWSTNPLFNSKHQLPPVLQVTMVAIDQVSAARLQERFGENLPADLELSEKFKTAADYEQDLRELESTLVRMGLVYRVFTSNIAIPASKWSSEQTQ